MPLFSVIIPTFNRRALLARTLASVQCQSWTDYELIVVDDGSTDGTMDDLQGNTGIAKVLTQPNLGPGSARNLALRHASGEYVAFLDSDDLWFPWSLDTYARVVQEENHPSFVAGHAHAFIHEQELGSAREMPLKHQRFADYFSSGDSWRWYGLSSFVVDRELILRVGGFASKAINGEDADLALRLGVAPGFVQLLSPVTYAYREHAGGVRHQLAKTIEGQMYQLEQEILGSYPGGAARQKERWRIMSPHVRSCSIASMKAGFRKAAWTLYRQTVRWHVALGRWKYLAAFPVLAFTTTLRNSTPQSSH